MSIISQALNAINDKRIAKAVQAAFDRSHGSGAVAAIGSSQATAAVLLNAINYVTGADATKAVVLTAPEPGDPGVWVVNTDATNALPIYPQTGAAINGGAANAAYTLPAAQAVFLVPATAGQWYAGIVGATSAQIAYLTDAVAGTAAASKVGVLSAAKQIDTFPANLMSVGPLGIETGITANAGGTQAAALALSATKSVHEVTTVGSAADSVALPAATGSGNVHWVKNSAATNSLQLFGAGTDTIDGVATATGVAVAAGKSRMLVDSAAGKWQSLLGA